MGGRATSKIPTLVEAEAQTPEKALKSTVSKTLPRLAWFQRWINHSLRCAHIITRFLPKNSLTHSISSSWKREMCPRISCVVFIRILPLVCATSFAFGVSSAPKNFNAVRLFSPAPKKEKTGAPLQRLCSAESFFGRRSDFEFGS